MPTLGWAGLIALLVLTGCGGGGSSGTPTADGGTPPIVYDRDGAAAAVAQGKQALQDAINTPPDTMPLFYDDGTSIGATFQQANTLDPTYEEGAFWSSLFQITGVLEGDAAKSLLSKLGWQNLHGAESEFGDLVARFSQSFGAGLTSVLPSTTTNTDSGPVAPVPPLGMLGVPNDPDDSHDPNQCVEAPPATLPCVDDISGWVPHPVYLFGSDPGTGISFISFQELFDFLTVTIGGAAHDAVAKLKGLSSSFSTTLTAIPFGESGDPLTITFDKTEADLVQVVYGVLEVLATLPTIWTWTGVDAFIAGNSTRDSVTGDWMRDDNGDPVDGISGDEATAFVRVGNDGIAGNGDEPLRSNASGLARLTGALSDLLGGAQDLFARIGAGFQGNVGDPLSGHVVTLTSVLTNYDDEPRVIAYTARALAGSLGEARASLTAATDVHVYQPLATIVSFDACPAGGSKPDLALHNAPNASAFPTSEDGLNLAGTVALDGSTGSAAVTLNDNSFESSAGVNMVKVTVPGVSHLSFYTEDAGASTDVDTKGDVAYLNTQNQIVAWDSDDNSGPGAHFGLSIDGATMEPGTMAGLAASGPYTFFVAVTRPAGTEVTLRIRSNTTGAWPAGAPIFLKGGSGRTFVAHVYSLGSLRVNSGEALKTASQFMDLSHRDSFGYIPDASADDPNTAPKVLSLIFDAGVLRERILAVLPLATFPPQSSLDVPPGTPIDILNAPPLDFTFGDLLSSEPQPQDSTFGTLTFCAPPGSLSSSNTITGGYMEIGF